MPKRPPQLKPSPKHVAFKRDKRESRHQRGYDYRHVKMRDRVLREEPLCYLCLAMVPRRYSASTIADHKVPKFEGGTDDRDNYGGACEPCHKLKTQAEAKRAAARART